MKLIRVFVIEDDWMCREAVRSIIEKTETLEAVGSAMDAESAIDKAIALKPDVVLMDLRLAGQLSGIDATARMVEACPQIKVVILTNCQDESSLHAAIDAGAVGYLLKSEVHDPAVILEAIREVHAGNGYITPVMSGKLISAVHTQRKQNNYGLTRREKEILNHISQGKNNRVIAEHLHIHERTVANHVSNILFKINAQNRTQAVALARKTGIIL